MDKKEIGVYIHIPFCKQKCFYCDFPSFAGKESYYEMYMKSLLEEINSFNMDQYKISTVFIGGGTPTVMPIKLLTELFENINKLDLIQGCEITIEGNPGTFGLEKLRCIKHYGINRLSMGLQTTDDILLKELGRIHSYKDFYENYNNAIKIGLSNINVDLMFALPSQKLSDYEKSLKTICQLKPKHISSYSLIIEDGTVFGQMHEEGILEVTDETLDRLMYEMTDEILKESGYSRYEISNYAQPSFECLHNLSYWTRKDYVGFGLGAHSLLMDTRYNNTYDLDNYIKNPSKCRENEIKLTDKDKMEEFAFLGFRILDGVKRVEFESEFGFEIESIFGNVLEKNITKNLIFLENDKYKLTNKGIDLSNSVLSDFIL